MAEEFDPKTVASWKKEVSEAKDYMAEVADLGAILLESSEGLSTSQQKQNKNLSGIVDASQKAARAAKLSLDQLEDRVDLIKDITKGELTLEEIKDKEQNLEKEIIKIRRRYKGVNKEIGDQKIRELMFDKEILGTEKERILAQEQSDALLGSMDDLIGGGLEGMKDFGMAMEAGLGPQAAILAGFTAIVAIITKFSSSIDQIGEQFGAIGVKDFASDLKAADAEMAKLGYDTGSAAEITEALTAEFGIGVKDAMAMTVAVGDMSKALGIGLSEGANLMGMFTKIGGMTPQQAEDTAKMAAQLAHANDVNPSEVLREISGSTETFAKFGKDGGKNLIEAAIVAKKLGTNLESVAGTMEGMLDFADSTTKAMEASIMLGRDINVQKMQELSLAGDAAGVLEEQKRLLGDANKWNSMNVLQRKALADAIGLSVEEANKMVNAEEEAASLAGELAKQPGFEELVGKEALSDLSQLIGSLTQIAAVLTNVLGPPLTMIVGVFAEGIGVIGSVIDTLYQFPAVAAVVGAAMIALNWSFLVTAITGVWAGVTSLMAIPFVGPAIATIAALGLISTIYGAISGAKSKKVGDAMIPGEGKGPVVSSPKLGGIFEGKAQDDVLMGPGLVTAGGAAGGTAGGTSSAVVDAISKLTETTQAGIDSRPTAKDIGKRTGKTLEQLGDA